MGKISEEGKGIWRKNPIAASGSSCDSPQRMPASPLRRTSTVKESCETQATGFGWSSLHRTLSRPRLVARPRSIAPFAPNPEGPTCALFDPLPRQRQPNQSSPHHSCAKWDSLRSPARQSFALWSSDRQLSTRSAEDGSKRRSIDYSYLLTLRPGSRRRRLAILNVRFTKA